MANKRKKKNKEQSRANLLGIILLVLVVLTVLVIFYLCSRSERSAKAAAEDPDNYYYQKYTPTISKPEVDSIKAVQESKEISDSKSTMSKEKGSTDKVKSEHKAEHSSSIPVYTNNESSSADHHEESSPAPAPAPKEDAGGHQSTEELESQF